MKKLSTYLFLILFSFSAPSFADDIRDFQIEGMSIGDSALDYFSAEEINANRLEHFEEPKFISIRIYSKNYKVYIEPNQIYSQNFKVYDVVQFFIKGSVWGERYKMYSITGYIDYDKNIDGCYKKLNELDKELSILFKDAKRSIPKTVKHPADKSGKSTIKEIFYDFPSSGDVASISCADWSSKMNYPDALYVNLDLQEVRNPPRCYNGYCY